MRELPPLPWRLRRYYVVGFGWGAAIGAVAVPAALIFREWYLAGGLFSVAVALEIAIVAAVFILEARERAKLRIELTDHDQRLCLRCCYVLDGLSPTGVCPECGSPYDIAELRDGWRELIG